MLTNDRALAAVSAAVLATGLYGLAGEFDLFGWGWPYYGAIFAFAVVWGAVTWRTSYADWRLDYDSRRATLDARQVAWSGATGPVPDTLESSQDESEDSLLGEKDKTPATIDRTILGRPVPLARHGPDDKLLRAEVLTFLEACEDVVGPHSTRLPRHDRIDYTPDQWSEMCDALGPAIYRKPRAYTAIVGGNLGWLVRRVASGELALTAPAPKVVEGEVVE